MIAKNGMVNFTAEVQINPAIVPAVGAGGVVQNVIRDGNAGADHLAGAWVMLINIRLHDLAHVAHSERSDCGGWHTAFVTAPGFKAQEHHGTAWAAELWLCAPIAFPERLLIHLWHMYGMDANFKSVAQASARFLDGSGHFFNVQPGGASKTLPLHLACLARPSTRHPLIVPFLALAFDHHQRLRELYINATIWGHPQFRDPKPDKAQVVIFTWAAAVETDGLRYLQCMGTGDATSQGMMHKVHMAVTKSTYTSAVNFVDVLLGTSICWMYTTGTLLPSLTAILLGHLNLREAPPPVIQANTLPCHARIQVHRCDHCNDLRQAVLDHIRACAARLTGSIMIFVHSRRAAEETASALGSAYGFFHAGNTPIQQQEVIAKWMSNEPKGLLGTKAAKPGLDKPNIGTVFWEGLPTCLIKWTQQLWRAQEGGPDLVPEAHLWTDGRLLRRTCRPPMRTPVASMRCNCWARVATCARALLGQYLGYLL